MTAQRLVALVAAMLLLLPVGALANGNGNGNGPDYMVNGGGQVIADASHSGPGDTIAFTAQRVGENEDEDGADPARGQLQVVARGDDGEDRGRSQALFHGQVTCIVPGDDNTARFGGDGRDPRTGETSEFVVDVMDADEQGNDTIVFRHLDEDADRETPCDDSAEDADTQLRDTKLARGNLTIHDRR